MQTKLKKYKETREDKGKYNLPFMTRLDSNAYKPFSSFLLGYVSFKNLHLKHRAE